MAKMQLEAGRLHILTRSGGGFTLAVYGLGGEVALEIELQGSKRAPIRLHLDDGAVYAAGLEMEGGKESEESEAEEAAARG